VMASPVDTLRPLRSPRAPVENNPKPVTSHLRIQPVQVHATN
jgi:hypothetical protein